MKQTLGELEAVDLRQFWKDEARDFTPWLAEKGNIERLGRAIGMELEVDSVEKAVGPFSADIVCRESAGGQRVVIENQLEKTDHSHLGQVLTYAAGLEAQTVIWVAQSFTPEHRAAIDWLNEITPENYSFFGVQIELWCIGESPPAARFALVCQPNDWAKAVQAAAARRELTEGNRTKLEFWQGFKEYMSARSQIRCPNPSPQQWMSHRIGISGCHLDSIFSSYDSSTGRAGGEIRVDVYLDGRDAKALFARLEADREGIESEVGETMTWYSPAETRMSRIFVRKAVDLAAREQWPSYYEWLRTHLEAAARVFAPRIRRLQE